MKLEFKSSFKNKLAMESITDGSRKVNTDDRLITYLV